MRFWLCLFAVLAAVSSARAAPPLEAYGRLPAIVSASLSPSGDRFAMVGTDKGGVRVFVRATEDGSVLGAYGFGDTKIRSLGWAGEDTLLIFGSRTIQNRMEGIDTTEMMGVMVVDVRTRAGYMIFGKSNTFVDAAIGWFGTAQVGGRWYAYVGGVPFSKTLSWSGGVIYPDLYRIDLATGRPELVARGGGERNWLVDRTGAILAYSAYEPRGDAWTLYAGQGPGKVLAQTSADSENRMVLAGVGRSPGTVLVSERTDKTLQVRELRVDGVGDGEVLIKDDNLAETIRDRDTGLVVGVGDAQGPRLFDPGLQRRIEQGRKIFAGDHVELISYSRDFNRQILRTEGPRNSGRYWIVDLLRGTAVPIEDARPEIPPAEVGPMRMFAYKAADGLGMEGVLTLPPGRDPKGLPLVVMPHGGPIAEGDTVSFDWWAQAFASRGYAVFQPNYRGTLGYGEAFRQAAQGEFGRKMQTDISDGVAALAAQGIVDPKRACIVGASYGGYAALAGVILQHGLYRCAVSVAGVTDMTKLITWERISSGRRDGRAEAFWRDLSGAGVKDTDAISPARFAAKADAPILLIHGEDDTVVPIEQSRMMERALKSAGKPVEFLDMPGEDHWLSKESTRQAMLASAVAFVEKNNPPN